MQELLTGKRRLANFKEEWKEIQLAKHVLFLKNGVNTRAELFADGEIKYLHYGDIHGSNDIALSPHSLPSLPIKKAQKLDRLLDGDLIFADASEDTNGIGKSVEICDCKNTALVAGLHTIAARFDSNILCNGFKGYLQFMPTIVNHLRVHATGTKVYAITRAHLANIIIKLPSLEEQSAIATVLSDMDDEITALEAKLAKARQIKKGMMQELLTGRIRLI